MVKLFKKISLLIVVLFISGCTKKSFLIYEGVAMTIPYKIIIGDLIDKKSGQLISKKINETFSITDRIFNNWNPNSEISFINQASENLELSISLTLFEFLEEVETVFLLTKGLFDPTILPLKDLWLSKLKEGSVPSEEEVQMYKEAVGFEKIRLNKQNLTITKSNSNTRIDLCGIAKGHTVDLLIKTLKDNRICNAYVEWGGEIKTIGKHPIGRYWQVIPIKTLNTPIEINSCAIASSGNYEQEWTVENKTYTHIIHPKTGCPLEINEKSVQATTVLHEKCLYADAMATTLMLFPSKEESQLWAECQGLTTYIKGGDS
ncbi:MAG: FAD:protein FMN transferase [Victivallaceae bacterium]